MEVGHKVPQFRHQTGWWLDPLLAVLVVDVMVTAVVATCSLYAGLSCEQLVT